MATRYIQRPDWPGHNVDEDVSLLWEFQWYLDYIQALLELIPTMQTALLEARIIPRGGITRAPLKLEKLRPWLELNSHEVIAAGSKTFWTDEIPSNVIDAWWPDAKIMPPMCVRIDDVATWAVAEGISAPGEIETLLQERGNGNDNTEAQLLAANNHHEEQFFALFDPVRLEVLEKMFPAEGQWKGWAERASRNGLVSARDGRAKFNPYKAAMWFLNQGIGGWNLARCHRTLANNLPVCSKDYKCLLTDDID